MTKLPQNSQHHIYTHHWAIFFSASFLVSFNVVWIVLWQQLDWTWQLGLGIGTTTTTSKYQQEILKGEITWEPVEQVKLPQQQQQHKQQQQHQQELPNEKSPESLQVLAGQGGKLPRAGNSKRSHRQVSAPEWPSWLSGEINMIEVWFMHIWQVHHRSLILIWMVCTPAKALELAMREVVKKRNPGRSEIKAGRSIGVTCSWN